MKVAVLGASGYTGLELLRLLLRHPRFEIAVVTSEQRAGQPVGEAFAPLRGQLDLRFESAAELSAWRTGSAGGRRAGRTSCAPSCGCRA